jgi:hypothetical protein
MLVDASNIKKCMNAKIKILNCNANIRVYDNNIYLNLAAKYSQM